MKALKLDQVEFNRVTAMPYELQFWEQFDLIFNLNEEEMKKELPTFVIDPNNKAKVEAVLAGRRREALGSEQTRQIEASI